MSAYHQAILNTQGGQSLAPGTLVPPVTPCACCQWRIPGSLCGTLIGDEVDLTGANPQSRLIPKLELHQTASRRQTIYRYNNSSDTVAIICEGWACVYISLPNGGRQILSILLPGDITSVAAVFQDHPQISVEAITDIHYLVISKTELKTLLTNYHNLFFVFSKALVDRKEEVENLATDLGHKNAEQRIARLILNLMKRHNARNQVHGGSFDFPLRQQHIADATGLTVVHVNRVLGNLRRLGIVEIKGRTLTVFNLPKLEQTGD